MPARTRSFARDWRTSRVCSRRLPKYVFVRACNCCQFVKPDYSILQMLPVLKSSMDDGDAKTRQLVCLALQYLFVALPGCLGGILVLLCQLFPWAVYLTILHFTEEPVHQLYAEILKRLDDSNDTVRKAACQTFKTFLRSAPKEHFKGTIIDYTLDCLFVHLDDSELEIQVPCHLVVLVICDSLILMIERRRLSSMCSMKRWRLINLC